MIRYMHGSEVWHTSGRAVAAATELDNALIDGTSAAARASGVISATLCFGISEAAFDQQVYDDERSVAQLSKGTKYIKKATKIQVPYE